MKLKPYSSGPVPPETDFEKDLERSLDIFFAQFRDLLNNGLIFADNFNCYVVTVTTPATPGNELAISHTLKRTPIGCFPIEKDKAAHIYKGPSGKNSTTYNIVSDVASVTTTLIIL